MNAILEIKWHGRAGQGVGTAASVLAEVLAMEGKYVQAFPEFDVEKRPPSVKAYNRFSAGPVKRHSTVKQADIVAVMDAALILSGDVSANAKDDALYIVNTSYTPEFVKEKLSAAAENIYTIDADKIAREEIGHPIPNIPMMAIIIRIIDWLPLERFTQHLGQILTSQLGDDSDLVPANLKTVNRALKEVRWLDNDN
jgi:pyruvate ferredoxin oxidoreductase gamma subunit